MGTDVHHNSTRRAAQWPPGQEAVMGQAVPTQHPAVVLRSHFNQLRALLAVAMIAVVGLTAAVVILATHDDRDTSTGLATQEVSAPSPDGTTRYDGGPEEGTAALTQRSAPATFDPNSIKQPPGVRYDGGPEEGTSGALFSDAPSKVMPGTRYDGGPEEGSSGIGH
jgi:hypothetical protein